MATAARQRLIIPAEGPGHTYTLDGRPLAGVTSVIHQVLGAPQLEEWMKRMGAQADVIRDEAAAFGSSVHAGLAAHARGDRLLPLDLPENWWAMLDAGREWIDENLAEIYAVEEPIASARYGFAGKPDVYGRRCGHKRPVIVDFKTTADVYWSHAFQLAAYRKAAVETYGDRPAERIVLRLSKDEPGRVFEHVFTRHDRDFAGFGYCLGLFNLMKEGL